MIRLDFQHASIDLVTGIQELEKHYSYEISDAGIPVHVTQRPGDLEILCDATFATIIYDQKIHFFRALGLLVEAIQQKSKGVRIKETPQFDFNGMMFDVSRNAVLSVESIKKLLRHMAILGLNGFMLYTEDVYTVADNPYFGYMRGKYSFEELKQIDDYAELFGIEVIPCIQTLAHVSHVNKWDFESAYTDTSDIFMIGAEKTYELIEKMIVAISSPFRSKRIHIGMDEAFFLGTGNYLQKHGYRDRFEMMNEHLNRVIEITDRYGLQPMMWSDMYFRMGSKTKDYYDFDAEVPQSIIDRVNKKTQMICWDYYHQKEEDFSYFLQKHFVFGSTPMFAGGLWTWNGVTPHYVQMSLATHAGLNACKKVGIREVFATIWADNGAETNLFAAFPGMQMYAEHGYRAVTNDAHIQERFHFCTGTNYDDFMLLSELNMLSDNDRTYLMGFFPSNPSKFLLWQDLLLGLFDKHVEGRSAGLHYYNLEKKIRNMADQYKRKFSEQDSIWPLFFEFYAQLSYVLSLKCEMGLQIKKHYDCSNHDALAFIIYTELPLLEKQVRVLRNLHRNLWFYTYKANGWEVIDIRYGGLLARIDSTTYRLQKYNLGKIDKIEELEEERLYYDGGTDRDHRPSGFCNYYHDIVTVGNLSEFTKM